MRPDAVLNACDPRFNEPIFGAAFDAKLTYLDMAMTLSHPHPERPYELPGEMLGDLELAEHELWKQAGALALVGIGVEPGLSDVFARYAADELFSSITEVGVRDGADLVVEGYDFAPTFSIWTTIEECLNPPLIWERERGFYTTAPFSEPEVFDFPEGIGAVECVNVEHEEVVLIPRWVQCERVTFKYGLGQEFIDVLSTLHMLGRDAGRGAAACKAVRDRVPAADPIFVQVDAANPMDSQRAEKLARENLGTIDVLVCSTGPSQPPRLLRDIPIETLQLRLNEIVLPPLHMMHESCLRCERRTAGRSLLSPLMPQRSRHQEKR